MQSRHIPAILVILGAAMPLGADEPRLDLSKLGLYREEKEVVSVLPPCPRELSIKLTRSLKAIEEDSFAEALEMVESLRAESDGKDYFIGRPNDSATHRGLQAEMERVLAIIAQRKPDLLDTRWGSRAARELEEAVQKRDTQALESVARQYMGVEAGQQAAILLSRLYLDNGRAGQSVAWLRTLKLYTSSRKYEPEATLLLAASMYASGSSPAEVNAVLEQLREGAAGQSLELGGTAAPLFDGSQTPAQWLARLLPAGFQAPALNGWILVRGGQDRNGGVEDAVLGEHVAWRVPVVDDPERRELLQEIDAFYREQDKTVWPSGVPLVVNQTVVARTLDRVYGIDPLTGKRLWWYPHHPFESALEDELDDISWSRKAHRLVWKDTLFGRLSSDGQHVYFLMGSADEPALDQVEGPFIINRANNNNNNARDQFNQLVALDVSAEGKLAFIQSGEDNPEPELRELYFLGPPLAVRGTLYCLAERNADVRLVALDAATGRLQWWINIANVSNSVFRADSDRRFAGLTPTFQGGVLICPTSAGVITAVDVQKRSLLWAYQYPVPASSKMNQQRVIMMRVNGRVPDLGNQEDEDWKDSTVIAAGKYLLATPILSDELYCLDLQTGDLMWKKPRRGMSYIGCVHNEVVFVVGEHRVTGLRVADGEPAWSDSRYVALPGGGNPSGLGFRSGDHYVVPTTDGELSVFDIASGQLVQRMPAPGMPGNLTPCTDGVLSQSPLQLQLLTREKP